MSKSNDIPSPSYPHREICHLREVLHSLCISEDLQTFRDPLSRNWELPPPAIPFWTPDQWTREAHAWEGASGISLAGSPAHGWDEESFAAIWRHRACEAWRAGDVACRSFVSELATVRLDAWNHGDKRRGKDRVTQNLGIALGALETVWVNGTMRKELRPSTPEEVEARGFDAKVCETVGERGYGRQPRALELAREIQGFRESQSETLGLASPIKGFRRAHRPGKPSLYVAVTEAARVSAAVADAGAALAGMVAARRLFDRDAWILLTRRALLGILAALVSLEADAAGEAGHNFPLSERRATAR